jgi:putative flippase GtrA
VARLLRGFARGEIPVTAIAAQFSSTTPANALTPQPRSLFRQGIFFATVGVISTLAYLVLFLALRSVLGAQGANLVALLLTAVANTAANRRFTFGVRGATGAIRQQCEGLLVFGIGLALTSGALGLLGTLSADPAHRAVEVGVLVSANLLATVVRFVLLRGWVFHPRRTGITVVQGDSNRNK